MRPCFCPEEDRVACRACTSIEGCCEIDKHSAGLFFGQKSIFNFLSWKNYLIYVDLPRKNPAYCLVSSGSTIDSTRAQISLSKTLMKI